LSALENTSENNGLHGVIEDFLLATAWLLRNDRVAAAALRATKDKK
jgi:hypothetical protein